MPIRKRGARVGAAAFVLGVSLAGPQATGVATADGTDSDAPGVSASPPAPAGRAAARAGRADRSDAHTSPPTPGSAAARTGRRVPTGRPTLPRPAH
ncbi:MAG: hypothetical protein ACR2JI_00650, partial [Mycobacterium sp.]